MCLCSAMIGRDIPEEIRNIKYGWKIFDRNPDNGTLSPWIVSYQVIPQDKWLDEKFFRRSSTESLIYDNFDKLYPTGFHFYLTRKDARLFNNGGSIRRIEVKDIVAFDGVQVVAKKMKVISNSKG